MTGLRTTVRRLVRTSRRYVSSRAAWKEAEKLNVPGGDFVRFGRRLGWRLAASGQLALGAQYILTPVISVRLFEFPFAMSALPSGMRNCLDVSSPRLFSLYVGRKQPGARIEMWNPDSPDIRETKYIISRLNLSNVRAEERPIDSLDVAEAFDCIWSISVIEHIEGVYDDRYAVRRMYEALRVGGRLILTFPVDREAYNQETETKLYGTQPASKDSGRYFFQRFYDLNSIEQRILSPLGVRPAVIRWFGEARRGIYSAYQERLSKQGTDARIEDPRMIAKDFRYFDSFDAMPGMGVCGLVIDKVE